MPVIGRLDKQVNDVLIDPVGNRRRRRDEGDETHSPSDARGGAPDGNARDVTRVVNDEASRSDEARPRARDEEQLPVWLL